MKTLLLLFTGLFTTALFSQDVPASATEESGHGLPFLVVGVTPFPDSISIATFNTGNVLKGVSLPRVAAENMVEYEVLSYTVSLVSMDGVREIKVSGNQLTALGTLLSKAVPGNHLLFTDIKIAKSKDKVTYLENVVCKLTE